MYDPTISDPMSDPHRELEDVVRCKGCDEWVSVSNNTCRCNVQCCESCGSASVLVAGERFCTVCDAVYLTDIAEDKRKHGPLYDCSEHPAFDGTWIGRVLEAVDGEEPTAKTRVPTMAELVGGAA